MQQPRLRAAADDSAIAGGGLRTAAPGGTQQAMPGSSAAAAATGSGGPEQETHLQRMLLEVGACTVICCGASRSGGVHVLAARLLPMCVVWR